MRSARKIVVSGVNLKPGRVFALVGVYKGAVGILAARSAHVLKAAPCISDERAGTKLALSTDVHDPSAAQQCDQRTINHAGALRDVFARGNSLSIAAFLTSKMRQKHGRVGITAAPLERIATPGFVAYMAATFGVERLTRTLVKKLRSCGIAVNGFHAGDFVDTSSPGFTLPKLPSHLPTPTVVAEPCIHFVTKPVTRKRAIPSYL